MHRVVLHTLKLKLPTKPERYTDAANEGITFDTNYIDIRASLRELGYVHIADYVIDIPTESNVLYMRILCERMLQDQAVKELLLEYII